MKPKERARLLADLDDKTIEAILKAWDLWRRDDQAPPDGDWLVWLVMGGRGAGKTRTGAEWVREQVRLGYRRIALVAETAADARDVMVEGESGIIECSYVGDRDVYGRIMGVPHYEPSKRSLTWGNGARAWTYNSREPGQLRGPQHDAAWADEIAKWRYPDAWDQLLFGLRLGKNPRALATTTPRNRAFIRDLVGDPGTVVTGASTYANRANLARKFVDRIIRRFEGTRLGRQELHGELLSDVPGALWTLDQIDALRCDVLPPEGYRRIVVAVDPAGSTNEGSDETGIVVAALDADERLVVLEDLSARLSPDEWGQAAVLAYDRWQADKIIGERNNGGDMVGNTVRGAATALFAAGKRRTKVIAYGDVWASKGKAIRAEPISAIYAQRRAAHAGVFKELEDQMAAFTIDFDRKVAGYSPDRLDAMVWAATELMLGAGIPLVGAGEIASQGGN
jgi:phage terminase large subunit-like protein